MRMVGSLGVMDIIETEPGFQNPNILQALSRMQSTSKQYLLAIDMQTADPVMVTVSLCVSLRSIRKSIYYIKLFKSTRDYQAASYSLATSFRNYINIRWWSCYRFSRFGLLSRLQIRRGCMCI